MFASYQCTGHLNAPPSGYWGGEGGWGDICLVSVKAIEVPRHQGQKYWAKFPGYSTEQTKVHYHGDCGLLTNQIWIPCSFHLLGEKVKVCIHPTSQGNASWSIWANYPFFFLPWPEWGWGWGMGEEGETDLNKTNKYFSFIHHHDLKYPSTATISAVFLIFSMHLSHPQGKPCPWFFSGRVSGGYTVHRQDFPWHRLPALLYWVVGGVGQGWNWIGASIFARKQYKSRYLVSKSKVSYVTRLIQTV